MTDKPTYYYGKAVKNERARSIKDPQLMGWVHFENGKASLAIWYQRDENGKADLTKMNLSLKPFGKARVYTYGNMNVLKDEDRVASHAPHMLGSIEWGGKDYSVASWINYAEDDQKKPFLKLKLRLCEDHEHHIQESHGFGYR